MIIFRYLARDILTALSAISAILLLIIMSGRFVKYLAQAVDGSLSPDVLLTIISYRIPGFLELLLPLSLFLGILMVYGRFYADSEMTVLFACGITPKTILSVAMVPALIVTLSVGFLTFWVSPWGANHVDRILLEQKNTTSFSNLTPGRFQPIGSESRVIYLQSMDKQKKVMRNILIAQQNPNSTTTKQSVLVAEMGYQENTPNGRFLVLKNGYRYDGIPGQADFRATHYQTYAVRLPEPAKIGQVDEEQSMQVSQLLTTQNSKATAEILWRISLLILIPIVTLIAVPLSKVDARQGRFAKLLPAIILYLLYLGSLLTLKGSIADGSAQAIGGLWLTHLGFFLIGLALNCSHTLACFWQRLFKRSA